MVGVVTDKQTISLRVGHEEHRITFNRLFSNPILDSGRTD